MDYSASLQDGENPAEASPWGSSPAPSPQHNRSTFNPISESLGSPVIYGQNRGHVDSYTGDTGTLESGEPGKPEEVGTAQTYDHGHDAEGPDTKQSTQQSGEGQQPPTHSEQPQQSHPGQDTQNQQATSRPTTRQSPHYRLQAKITGLERVGRKDPILRFDIHTNLPSFRTTQFRDVRRTHSEFIKLADHLISSNPEAIVPAVPPALTSAGAGTDEDEARVKASLQRWLNYVCGNDVLMRDEEMVLFVESDYGYSPMVKRKQPATGVRRKVIKQFAPPPDDTPELEDARPAIKQFYLGTMDAGHKVDRLVKARKGLGLAESDFGVKLGTMSIQELHGGLANAYRKLGKTIQTTGDYHAAQGTAEATTIGDPLAYHSEDAFIVKETLTNRHILMRELLQAEALSKAKVEAADRLKVSSSVKREKVDEAIASMDKARSNELHLRSKTQRVTVNLVQETRRWFSRTTTDVRQSLREYVLREIEAERRTLATLETIRPDIRAIDASGGLSRLGRESHPTVRRASLAASQGPKGDAWSGVPRRPDASRNVSSTIVAGVLEDEEAETSAGRGRALSGGSSGGLIGVKEEEDEDRVDARNAASRLATSTF